MLAVFTIFIPQSGLYTRCNSKKELKPKLQYKLPKPTPKIGFSKIPSTIILSRQDVVSPKQESVKDKKDNIENYDLQLLSHAIEHEAGGQSKRTKLYVASVVINRVTDKRFPNSIKDVLFQKNQYENIDDAMQLRPSNESIKCAEQILKNGSVLPSKVIYQAEYPIGRIFCKSGTEYFCFG